ncbi:MAG: FKBP-type peptidyl-prolyl cis-trans isomerase [Candidatus Aenigmarchaeota archaeon]|nr:FKBP-type peptidyl-prolyl cis-trans isomerase [Candidatus Aenigmarchaeota archaeon]
MAEKKTTTKKTSGVKAAAPKRARPATRKTATAKKASPQAKRSVAKKPVSKAAKTTKTTASRAKKPVAKKTTRPVAKRPAAKKAVAKKQKKVEKKSIFNRFKKFALPFAALILVAILALAATGNLGDYNLNSLFNSELSDNEPSIMVESGDTVEVNYIGSFTDGEVFDTSYEQVAKDNELYLEGRSYSPLGFEVGAGQMIKGFDAAVVSMTVGETKTVTLAPEDAYGPSDPTKIVDMPTSIDRIITLEREFEIALADFAQVFAEDPVVDNIVSSDAFPWNFSVREVSDSNVSLEYMIDVNDTIILPQTIWESKVVSKNDTTITIIQNPEDGAGIETIFGTGIITLTEDKINIGFDVTVGEKVTTPYGEGTIVGVTDESVTLDLNPAMVGKTLVFEITVVNVTKADVSQSDITIIDSE